MLKIKVTPYHQHTPKWHLPSVWAMGDTLFPAWGCHLTVISCGQCWADKTSVWSSWCHTPQGSLGIIGGPTYSYQCDQRSHRLVMHIHGAWWGECTTVFTHFLEVHRHNRWSIMRIDRELQKDFWKEIAWKESNLKCYNFWDFYLRDP